MRVLLTLATVLSFAACACAAETPKTNPPPQTFLTAPNCANGQCGQPRSSLSAFSFERTTRLRITVGERPILFPRLRGALSGGCGLFGCR